MKSHGDFFSAWHTQKSHLHEVLWKGNFSASTGQIRFTSSRRRLLTQAMPGFQPIFFIKRSWTILGPSSGSGPVAH
jgi:hypothetical protein